MKRNKKQTKAITQSRIRGIVAIDMPDLKPRLRKAAKKSKTTMSGFIRKVLSKELGVRA